VYVVPATGGEPVRLTHHPMADRVVGWTPDGTRVLFASSRESGRQRYNQFFTVGLDGGLPQKLPVPYGEFGTYSPDGAQFVYMPMAQDFRTWKRYRGGWAPDLWLFDLQTFASRKLTDNPGNDAQPMWHGNTLYFLSDRGDTQRNNIWAHDMSSNQVRKVTDFGDFDITFPSMGPDAIVFQAGGRLYLLDLPSEDVREVPVRVVTDEATLRPRTVKGDGHITSAAVSPTGKRAVFNVRGDIVTVPAEHGAILNLTRSSGVAERYPRWSPDGQLVAYWSDRSGEYELTVRPADGTGEERKLTSMGKGYRYPPQWSPDSKKLAFVDQSMKVYLFDMDGNRLSEIDQSPWWMGHGALEAFRFSWSPDSRWVTYARADQQTGNSAIFVYDTRERKLTQATSGYLTIGCRCSIPRESTSTTRRIARSTRCTAASTTAGRMRTRRSWSPRRCGRTSARRCTRAMTRNRPPPTPVPSPARRPTRKTRRPTRRRRRPPEARTAASRHHRLRRLREPRHRAAAGIGQLRELQAVKGKVLYRRTPRAGSGRGERSPIVYFDLQERAEKTVLDNADGFMVTHDGSKLFVRQATATRWSRSSRTRSSTSRCRSATSRCP
jgi:tricorn protease